MFYYFHVRPPGLEPGCGIPGLQPGAVAAVPRTHKRGGFKSCPKDDPGSLPCGGWHLPRFRIVVMRRERALPHLDFPAVRIRMLIIQANPVVVKPHGQVAVRAAVLVVIPELTGETVTGPYLDFRPVSSVIVLVVYAFPVRVDDFIVDTAVVGDLEQIPVLLTVVIRGPHLLLCSVTAVTGVIDVISGVASVDAGFRPVIETGQAAGDTVRQTRCVVHVRMRCRCSGGVSCSSGDAETCDCEDHGEDRMEFSHEVHASRFLSTGEEVSEVTLSDVRVNTGNRTQDRQGHNLSCRPLHYIHHETC